MKGRNLQRFVEKQDCQIQRDYRHNPGNPTLFIKGEPFHEFKSPDWTDDQIFELVRALNHGYEFGFADGQEAKSRQIRCALGV